ncbi:MAG: phenylacetate-CoA oxygenase subunit PaaJ [Propionibacteriales bacterium]|nr:phenylacetate-CoA oxygenase subunit PaaJ [Propionibacteriales bacterium]
MVSPRSERARELAAQVLDPEMPLLTIEELGILRDATVDDEGRVEVSITPTYSGCPAFDAIRTDVHDVLARAGYAEVTVKTVWSPPWTTDWISEEGSRKLAAFGTVPPPARADAAGGGILVPLTLRCPHCGSPETRELSRFGSTACKALWACNRCGEPFDHVKAF